MLKPTNKRNAFTLLELLVVIVIIAILAAILAGSYGQVRENGYSTTCKGHLKSLYQAALNYAVDHGGGYPLAGPFETHDTILNTYTEYKAWVNWTGNGNWPSGPNYPGPMIMPTWYGNAARTSITNGTLWEYISHDQTAYVCPKFRSLMQSYDVVRSYVMNYAFGCIGQGGGMNFTGGSQEASRTLMFADMQTQQRYPGAVPGVALPNVCQNWVGNGGDDGVLYAPSIPSGTPPIYQASESIGFIHRMSGEFRGHVVFMDGHIEAIGLKQPDGTWSNRTFDACSGQY